MTQLTNRAIWDRLPQRWLHVNLTQLSIKNGIIDFEQEDGPLPNRSNKKSLGSGHLGNRSKSLIIVMTMLLLKATHHKMIFVLIMRATGWSRDLIDSLASNGSHLRRQRNKIPSIDALQSSDILNYGMLPI